MFVSSNREVIQGAFSLNIEEDAITFVEYPKGFFSESARALQFMIFLIGNRESARIRRRIGSGVGALALRLPGFEVSGTFRMASFLKRHILFIFSFFRAIWEFSCTGNSQDILAAMQT